LSGDWRAVRLCFCARVVSRVATIKGNISAATLNRFLNSWLGHSALCEIQHLRVRASQAAPKGRVREGRAIICLPTSLEAFEPSPSPKSPCSTSDKLK